MSSELTVGITERGHTTVVTVDGEVDIASAPRLEDALRSALAEGPGRVVVDLTGLQFMDVSGVRVLVNAARSAKRTGGTIVLTNASASFRRLLGLTGTDAILGEGSLAFE